MTDPQHPNERHQELPSHGPERSQLSLRIQLLGGFTLTRGDRTIDESAWRLRKAQSLVKLLALAPGHRLYRERALELLWPDLDVDAAANNLHYALNVARNTLAPLWAPTPLPSSLLRLRQQVLALEPSVPLWVDVDAFEAAAAQARRSQERAAYEAAIVLYTGELLPGDLYEDWTTGRREGLRQTQIGLLLAVADRYRAQGAPAEAVDALERVLALEPAHEEAHVALMRLYAAAGQRHQAIRQYERLRDALRRELDAAPAPASQRLYEEILAGSLRGSPPPEPTAATAPDAQEAPSRVGPLHPQSPAAAAPAPSSRSQDIHWTPSAALPLIGRHDAMEQVRAAWAAAAVQPHVLVIAGEAGIGKTRVAEEAVAWASSQHIATAQARCYAAEGALPFAPVAAWLRTSALWAGLLTLDAVWLAEIVRIVPELAVERPELAPPAPITEDWQRQRWVAALGRAMLACEQPLLLVLDDLQWCDRETLEWLRYLLHQPARAPLLLVMTLRAEEVDAEHPVAPLLIALRRADQLTEMELGPLDAAETAALAARVADQALDPQQTAWLHAETEGNPLFVVQFVRAGGLSQRAEGSDGGRATPPPGLLPGAVRAVIEGRLRQLSPTARELVRLAATIGREFSFDLLLQASRHDEETLVQSLEELWQRRIVREQTAGSYDFSHDKLREVAYATMTATRRRALHRQVAQALEALPEPARERRAAELAWHFLEAGERQRALPYVLLAGDQAEAVFAHGEAEQHYRAALDLAGALGDPMREAEAQEKLGGVWHIRARYDEALEALERAAELYGIAGDREARALVVARIGWAHAERGAHAEGVARVRQELSTATALMPPLTPRCQAALYLALTRLYFVVRSFDESLSASTHAIELAREAGDEQTLLWAMAWRARMLSYIRAPEGLAALEEVVAHAEAAGDLWSLLRALNGLAELPDHLGHFEQANQYYARAFSVAERLGDPAEMAFALSMRGLPALRRGQWGEARADFERAEAFVRQVPVNRRTSYPLFLIGALDLYEGKAASAGRYLEEALAMAQRCGDLQAQRYTLGLLAEADLMRRQPAAAQARLDPVLGRPGEQGEDIFWTLPMMAWAYLDQGQVAQAEGTLVQGLSQTPPVFRLELLRIQALLSLRHGRWQEAATALEESLTLCRAMLYPYAEAKALYVYGQLYAAIGEPGHAREQYEAALAILNRLGERLYAEHVELALTNL